MILVAIFIGVILVVAAIRDTQGDLFDALRTDVPAFAIWAAALVAIGALGYIPGVRPVSRGLLALVIVVLVVNNYARIIAGFQHAWQSPPSAGTASPGSTGGSSSGTLASSLGGSVASEAAGSVIAGLI